VPTTARVDLEQGVQAGPEAPGPLPLAVLLVPGLIDVEPRLVGQSVEQFLIGSLQRPADLGDDPRQFAARDRHPDDIAAELAAGRGGARAGRRPGRAWGVRAVPRSSVGPGPRAVAAWAA